MNRTLNQIDRQKSKTVRDSFHSNTILHTFISPHPETQRPSSRRRVSGAARSRTVTVPLVCVPEGSALAVHYSRTSVPVSPV